MTKKRRLHETLTVRVGAVGVAEEGIGIVGVTLDLDTMDDVEIGKVMAAGFRAAHTEAIQAFGPRLTEVWAAQPDRIREGDDVDLEDEEGLAT